MATTSRKAPSTRAHARTDVRRAHRVAPLVWLLLVLMALALLALLAMPAIGLAAG